MKPSKKRLSAASSTRLRYFAGDTGFWKDSWLTKQRYYLALPMRTRFFLESLNDQWKLPRPVRNRGGKVAKLSLSVEHIPVLIARDRNGEIFDAIPKKVNAKQLGVALKPFLSQNALLCTDGTQAFKANDQVSRYRSPSHEYHGGVLEQNSASLISRTLIPMTSD